MNDKLVILFIFVFAGIGCGMLKDWTGNESLWVLQVGFLLTANLMMLENAWRERHRTKRLFVFPTLGVFALSVLIAMNVGI